MTLTENAAAAIVRLVTRSRKTGVDGLRIEPAIDSNALEAKLSGAGRSGDSVVERADARVYFDSSLVERLAKKELDVSVNDRTAKFTLRARR